MASTEQLQSVNELLEWGRKFPALFVEKFMGAKLWSKQREIVEDVFRYPRVAVKSCHSSGKTFVAARTALAFFLLYPNSKVLSTGPTKESVEREIWAELHSAYSKLPELFKGGMTLNQTELRAAPDWWAIGLSTDQGVRFHGHHAPHIFVLFDEANGVNDDIWEAADSLGAGGDAHYLFLANPLFATGRFYEVFNRHRTTHKLHTISAFDTPNLQGLTTEDVKNLSPEELSRNVDPNLISRNYVRHILDTAGEESDTYRIRVLGEFPTGSTQNVIPLAWVERAVERWKSWRNAGFPGDLTGVGVDVGQSHDVSVLALRYDRFKVRELRRYPREGQMAIAGRALAAARNTSADIIVDSIGMGAGVYDQLREREATHPGKWKAHAFVASQKSLLFDRSGTMGFHNRRAEAWWGLREALDPEYNDDVCLPDDPDLIEELTLPTFRVLTGGKYLIESKDDIRARLGGRSTDSADAVIMALSVERPERARMSGGRKELQPSFQGGVERVTSLVGGREYDPERQPLPLLGTLGDWTVQ